MKVQYNSPLAILENSSVLVLNLEGKTICIYMKNVMIKLNIHLKFALAPRQVSLLCQKS